MPRALQDYEVIPPRGEFRGGPVGVGMTPSPLRPFEALDKTGSARRLPAAAKLTGLRYPLLFVVRARRMVISFFVPASL
jgi:hypothetical protein